MTGGADAGSARADSRASAATDVPAAVLACVEEAWTCGSLGRTGSKRSLPLPPLGGSPAQRPRRPASPPPAPRPPRAASDGSAAAPSPSPSPSPEAADDDDDDDDGRWCDAGADEDDLLACGECPSAVLGATPLPAPVRPGCAAAAAALGGDGADATWASDAELRTLIGNLRASEADLRPSPTYLADSHGPSAAPGGGHIDASMRALTVSWLVEVGAEYGFHAETLAVAVALLDRFLSASRRLHRGSLQLAALAAALVAAKHEEPAFPPAADLAALAGHAFSSGDVVRMEGVMMQAVGFRVAAPTAATALALLARAAAAPPRVVARATYLLELALLDYDALAHAPSSLAAAALVLATRAEPGADAAAAAAAAAAACDDAGEVSEAARHLVALHAAAAARVAGGAGAAAAAADAAAADVHPADAVVAKFAAPEWGGVALEPALA